MFDQIRLFSLIWEAHWFFLWARGTCWIILSGGWRPACLPFVIEDRRSIYSTHTLKLLSFLRWSLIECDLFKMLCITLKTKSLNVLTSTLSLSFSVILRGLPCSVFLSAENSVDPCSWKEKDLSARSKQQEIKKKKSCKRSSELDPDSRKAGTGDRSGVNMCNVWSDL